MSPLNVVLAAVITAVGRSTVTEDKHELRGWGCQVTRAEGQLDKYPLDKQSNGPSAKVVCMGNFQITLLKQNLRLAGTVSHSEIMFYRSFLSFKIRRQARCIILKLKSLNCLSAVIK